MEFGKRHDTTDRKDVLLAFSNALQVRFRAWRALNSLLLTYLLTYLTAFCPRQLVTDLLRGNCCNGFWPI